MTPENSDANGRNNQGWAYEAGKHAAMIVRGYSDQYSIHFLGLLELNVDPESPSLEEITVLAETTGDHLEDLDLESSPAELEREMSKQLQRTTETNLVKDSSRIRNKFHQEFSRSAVLEELAGQLRKEHIFETEEILREVIEEEIFTASECELEFNICAREPDPEPSQPSEPEETASEDQVAQEIEEPVDHLLEVEACVKPVEGKELRNLQLRDDILVRVVGESARRINSALVDDEAPEKYPFSRPIPAPVAAIKEGPGAAETQFWVKLKEGVFGRGQQASSAQAQLHQSQSEQPPAALSALFFLAIFLTLFSVIIFLLFLGFPRYFFYVF